MFPTADLRYLNRVAARKAMVVVPARSIEDKLLDPITLINVASGILLEIVREERKGYKSACLFGVGALINAAAQFPLRHCNWHRMIIERHVNLDTGRVTFTAAEMKRREPFEGVLPPEVLVPLRCFVHRYRPQILDPEAVDEGYLWPSRSGGILHRNTLCQAVTRVLRKHTGKAFNFHLFRHAAATFISENKPEQTRMAAGVLHHKGLRTTNKHYIRGKKRRAFEQFQQAVREVIVRGRRRKVRKDRTQGHKQRRRVQAPRRRLKRKDAGSQ